MEKYCEAQMERIDGRINTNEKRLNGHSEEIDKLKLDMVAIQKDSSALRDSMKELKKSVDTLIVELGKLKIKPLERYEKIILVVITFIITYLFNKSLGV